MADGDNECIPYYEPGSNLTAQAEAAVIGKRLVSISDDIQGNTEALDPTDDGGNIIVSHAAADAIILGVAAYDAGIGSKLVVITAPRIVPVKSAANITAGNEVEVATAGQVIPQDDGKAVGLCLADCTSGDDAMIMLYLGAGGAAF
jgi:hypothetical protein